MIRALGVSETPFDPFDPGRLCRGRERWIDPWEHDAPHPEVHRLVVSGAAFDDDSARDARRGVPFAGVRLSALIEALFPGKGLIAFTEDGHPADIPEGAEGVEAYTGHRAGGRGHEPMVRWWQALPDARSIALSIDVPSAEAAVTAAELGLDAVFGADLAAGERIRGYVVADKMTKSLAEKLFLFVGMSTLDSPPARFQPGALNEILAEVPAVIALHRDKHGPVVGVYAREPLHAEERLRALCTAAGSLYVPFAIPPMLARWDRALADLRAAWNVDQFGPFPVPENPHANPWGRRRRRTRDEGAPDIASIDDLPPLDDVPVAAPLTDEPADLDDDGPDDGPEGDDDDGPDDDGPEGDDDDGPEGDDGDDKKAPRDELDDLLGVEED